MTTRPRARSMPLAFPQVCVTKPTAGAVFRFCRANALLQFVKHWDRPIISVPCATANVNQSFHHVMQISAPLTCAESVVQRFVNRIKLAVNRVRLRIGLINFRLQPRHRLLCIGKIFVNARDYRVPAIADPRAHVCTERDTFIGPDPSRPRKFASSTRSCPRCRRS